MSGREVQPVEQAQVALLKRKDGEARVEVQTPEKQLQAIGRWDK